MYEIGIFQYNFAEARKCIRLGIFYIYKNIHKYLPHGCTIHIICMYVRYNVQDKHLQSYTIVLLYACFDDHTKIYLFAFQTILNRRCTTKWTQTTQNKIYAQ